jgi:CelD/BcsL family acetyltransferase involved in cellulose biosynthesis
MRNKGRTFASYGNVRFEQARGCHEVRRALGAFFKRKSARMRTLGADIFAAPGVRRFKEAAAAEQLPNGEPLIEIYALSVGDIIAAIFGGIVSGERFSGVFNSIIK